MNYFVNNYFINIELGKLIIFLFIGLNSFKLITNTLYNFYLWQIKEYRFDRLKSHFEIPQNKWFFLSQLNFFYFNNFKYPKITLRILLSLGALLVINYHLFFFILEQIFSFISHYVDVYAMILISLLCLNLLNFLIVSLLIFLFNLITAPFKCLVVMLAKNKLDKYRSNLKIIGITGSYGKTSTKEIVSHVLSSKYQVLKTPHNWNTNLGISKTILANLNSKHQVFVAEIGAYKKGEIKSICAWLKPDIGILTGINKQHLSLFGSLENTQKAKSELIDSLDKNGLAFFNVSNNYVKQLMKKIEDIEKVAYGKTIIKNYKTNLAGEFQQINIDAAFKLARKMNIKEKVINKSLQSIPYTPYMLQIKKGRQGVKLIDDSYNSNPDGFLSALKILNKRPEDKKIVLTPGIIELGKSSEKTHKLINKKLNSSADKVILTKKNFAQYIEAEVITNPQKIIHRIKKYCNPNTVILLEGRIYKSVKEFLLKNE